MKNIADYITEWLRSYSENSGTKGFVIGISGGIDSSVASTLCARTGLPLLLVEMPIGSKESSNHIQFLKDNFSNVESAEIDLTNTFNSISKSLNISDYEKSELSLVNTRSRLRMTTLYALSIVNDFLVCGTGNKVEDFGIGFFTKFGDGGVDISPLGDLMKSEVYLLGKELGLIDEVLNSIPTDGLWEGSPSDEDQIGATYDELEWAMEFTEKYNGETNGNSVIYDNKVLNITDRELEVLDIYNSRHIVGQHKMKMPPICDLSIFKK